MEPSHQLNKLIWTRSKNRKSSKFYQFQIVFLIPIAKMLKIFEYITKNCTAYWQTLINIIISFKLETYEVNISGSTIIRLNADFVSISAKTVPLFRRVTSCTCITWSRNVYAYEQSSGCMNWSTLFISGYERCVINLELAPGLGTLHISKTLKLDIGLFEKGPVILPKTSLFNFPLLLLEIAKQVLIFYIQP